MNRNCTLKLCLIIASVIVMTGLANAQKIDMENSTSFKNHNFLIAEQRFNDTPGKILALATPDELFFVTTKNETVVISLAE